MPFPIPALQPPVPPGDREFEPKWEAVTWSNPNDYVERLITASGYLYRNVVSVDGRLFVSLVWGRH